VSVHNGVGRYAQLPLTRSRPAASARFFPPTASVEAAPFVYENRTDRTQTVSYVHKRVQKLLCHNGFRQSTLAGMTTDTVASSPTRCGRTGYAGGLTLIRILPRGGRDLVA
jgi:hypothetical protein